MTTQSTSEVLSAAPIALLRRDVCRITALSKSTLYSLIMRCEFPRPAKIGTRSIWLSNEVYAWLQARFDARELKA